MAEPLIKLIGKMTTTSMLTKVTVQSNEDTEQLRKAYEEIIIMPNWKEEFEKVADKVITDLTQTLNTIDNPETTITMACNKQLFEFTDKKCILLGTKEGCDVQLSSNLGCSRLHAILFPLPKFGIFTLVDLGSVNGLKTNKRSIGANLVNSLPKERNLLSFTWNEIAILNFGNQVLAINPKTCIICMDKPRDQKFSCGHYSTCSDCTKLINKCPLCKTPKLGLIHTYDLKTNLIN